MLEVQRRAQGADSEIVLFMLWQIVPGGLLEKGTCALCDNKSLGQNMFVLSCACYSLGRTCSFSFYRTLFLMIRQQIWIIVCVHMYKDLWIKLLSADCSLRHYFNKENRIHICVCVQTYIHSHAVVPTSSLGMGQQWNTENYIPKVMNYTKYLSHLLLFLL